jgi:hypothetical protein
MGLYLSDHGTMHKINSALTINHNTCTSQAERESVRRHRAGLGSKGKSLHQLRKCANDEEKRFLDAHKTADDTANEWLANTRAAIRAADLLGTDASALIQSIEGDLSARQQHARYAKCLSRV